jgi:hypothetical protein
MVGLNMQRTRLALFGVIALFILLVSSMIFVYTFTPPPYEKEKFLGFKSVTLGGGKHEIVEFYISSPASYVKFDFNISRGTIKHLAEPSSHFNQNQSYFEQFVDEVGAIETDNGITGGGWTIGPEVDDRFSEEYTDQIWYLYLLNEDTYEKEVTIEISKVIEYP